MNEAEGTVVSVNVGLPRALEWRGRVVLSGIVKSPVDGPVTVRTLGLEGDGVAGPDVHGGPLKAVYAYPAEHYAFWSEAIGIPGDEWGTFGENLTTRGLTEETTFIGDRFSIGSAELRVTEPRMPCHKLEMRLGRRGLAKEFLDSGRSGFYLAVVREGVVRAGDPIVRLGGEPGRPSVLGAARDRRRR